jgi:hypothetical protein
LEEKGKERVSTWAVVERLGIGETEGVILRRRTPVTTLFILIALLFLEGKRLQSPETRRVCV